MKRFIYKSLYKCYAATEQIKSVIVGFNNVRSLNFHFVGELLCRQPTVGVIEMQNICNMNFMILLMKCNLIFL